MHRATLVCPQCSLRKIRHSERRGVGAQGGGVIFNLKFSCYFLIVFVISCFLSPLSRSHYHPPSWKFLTWSDGMQCCCYQPSCVVSQQSWFMLFFFCVINCPISPPSVLLVVDDLGADGAVTTDVLRIVGGGGCCFVLFLFFFKTFSFANNLALITPSEICRFQPPFSSSNTYSFYHTNVYWEYPELEWLWLRTCK